MHNNQFTTNVYFMLPFCPTLWCRNISTTVGWVADEFYTDIDGPRGMNPNDIDLVLCLYKVEPTREAGNTLCSGNE